MSNQFAFGTIPASGGFLAYYRMVHRSDNFILREGRHDIIFSTRHEAYEAAGKAFLSYLNSPISGLMPKTDGATTAADAVFNLKPFVKPEAPVKRKIYNTRQAGKSR